MCAEITRGRISEAVRYPGGDEQLGYEEPEHTEPFMSAPLTLIHVRPQHIGTETESAERRWATRVQHTLLPTKFPECAGYRFSAYWRPLHGPGGDF